MNRANLVMSAERAGHHVYVVELDVKVLTLKRFLEKNPNYQDAKAPLYVGMTGLTPEQRFDNHKAGHKANRYVRDYGIRLRPDMYQTYNPMTYKQAVAIEAALADDLRREGHAVWQA